MSDVLVESRPIGDGRIRAGAVGLGCLSMSWAYGDPGERDDAESTRAVSRAADLGVNMLDTADSYGPFSNETLLGRAIAGRREDYVIATKGGVVVHDQQFGMHRDGRPEHLRAALEGSLRRLSVEYIDLYYLHRVDRKVPLEDSWGAMADFVSEGKVRALGISEPTVQQAERAHATHPISAIQSEFSLWHTQPAGDLMPWCREHDVSFVAFAPLGQGFLTGSVTQVGLDDYRSRNPRFGRDFAEPNAKLLSTVQAIADRHEATAAQIAIAFVLSFGTNVFPIPGTKRVRYLEENASAFQVRLNFEDLAELHAASRKA